MSTVNKISYPLLGGILLLLCIASLCFGAVDVPLRHLFEVFSLGLFSIGLSPFDPPLMQDLEISRYVVMDIRLPRLVTTVIVGLGLASAGVCMQALFRNPLADPALIGVSNGAAVGAVSVIVFSSSISAFTFIPLEVALPVAAFVGGAIATTGVVAISTYRGHSDTALLLLAGVAINAIAAALVGLLTYIADDNQLRDLTFWSMGSTAKTQWRDLFVAAPLILVSSAMLLKYRTTLNCLLMGEQVAEQIGYDVKKIKRRMLVLTTIIVGTCVSISGVIFFIGLVVPHLVRLCCGPDHKNLLPLSALAGAVLLVLADNLASVVVAPAELPIGLLMSVLGGPFFIYLLLQQRKQQSVF